MARILVVDDEEAMREIMVVVLIRHGYEAQCVPNGVDALSLLDDGEKFDLITCDLMNYPMDGLEFCKQMKSRYPAIPILVITASRDIRYSQYLSKGDITPERFVGSVRLALESRPVSDLKK